LPLLLRESRLSPEPRDVAVCLPRSKLPRIDDLIPLGSKEQRRDLVITGSLGGISKQRADVIARRDAHRTDLRLVES